MNDRQVKPASARVGRIGLKLQDVNQLFNSMDPAPFPEKDLDDDAENFIVSWAREFPRRLPLLLVVHLPQKFAAEDPTPMIAAAVQNFFRYKMRLARRELRQLLRTGQTSLFVGLTFLTLCLLGGELLARLYTGDWTLVLREGLTIAGWVAMWRPMQIYLYDWWPLQRNIRVYRKLSQMPVQIRWRA
ncbi:MAG: hypothetical protein WC058_16005 [Phycisphaeraceae bacterium]